MKIVSCSRLREIVPRLKRAGKKVVFTNGCFDLLHVGHLRILREAKRLGDILIIGLNADRSVKKLKGPGRPLVPQRERAELLAALEPVDYVVVFGEETPARLIAALRPDILVKGNDYASQIVIGREVVEQAGGKVVLIPMVRNRSTTRLMNKMRRS